MIHLYQVIGEPEKYFDKNFLINGQVFKTILSLDALKKYLEKRDNKVQITFFVPESLLITQDLQKYKDILSNKGISDFELVEIPSVGEYHLNGQRRFFISNVDTIMVAMLLKFIEDRPDIFYIDVSTGQNIYTTQLVEAARNYLLYRTLETVLQSDQTCSGYMCFVPPITPNVQSYNIELEEITVNASFTLPDSDTAYVSNLDSYEIPRNVKKMLDKRMKKFKFKNNLESLLDELKMAYNAIKLNVPLAFYQILKMEMDPEPLISEFIKYVKELMYPVRVDNYTIRLPIKARQIVNTLLSIALYSSIKKFKHELDEPEVEEIEKKFGEIYSNQKLGLKSNKYFLERDLRNIKEIASKNKNKLSQEGEILGKLRSRNPLLYNPRPFDERNFFAHSGFLDDCTIVSYKEDKIYIRWEEKEIPNIMGVLKKN